MSLRDLMMLLVVFALVSLGIWTATLNTDPVTFNFPGFPPAQFETSVWVVGFLAILTGVLGTLLYTVVLSSKAAFVRWRSGRSARKVAGDTETVQSALVDAVAGDHGAALDALEGVLENDPERLDAWIQGGNAARAHGNLEKAVEMHLRARGLAPDDGAVHEALARDFEALGEYARAVGHLEQSLAAEPKGDADLFARMRDLLAMQARWDEAIRIQDKRIKLFRDPEVQEAEVSIGRGLRLEKGRALLEQGTSESRKAALAIFATLRKEDPTLVPVYLLEGRARMADNDAVGAVQAWNEGVAETHALELLNELVTYYFEAGDPERAIHTFRDAADSIDGADGRAARLGLALLYSRLEMIEEARIELERLEDEVEFSPTVAYHLAKLSARSGDAAGAVERFRHVIKASNLLEPRYSCRHCSTRHDAYSIRCAECGRWGTVVLDTSEELRPVTERGVRAPQV